MAGSSRLGVMWRYVMPKKPSLHMCYHLVWRGCQASGCPYCNICLILLLGGGHVQRTRWVNACRSCPGYERGGTCLFVEPPANVCRHNVLWGKSIMFLCSVDSSCVSCTVLCRCVDTGRAQPGGQARQACGLGRWEVLQCYWMQACITTIHMTCHDRQLTHWALGVSGGVRQLRGSMPAHSEPVVGSA